MADYDSGEVTEREQLAADKTKQIADYNAAATKTQAQQQLKTYDLADAQNAATRDNQLKQASRKSEADRFEAQRGLRNASLGLLGNIGNQALNGSALGNYMSILRDRNDADNNTYWQQLAENQDAIRNAYDESANQNNLGRADVVVNAAKALADIEADLAANLANINPNLYEVPGTGAADLGASGYYDENIIDPRLATLAGYLMPDNAEQAVRPMRNRIARNDYFSRLMNGYNNRR